MNGSQQLVQLWTWPSLSMETPSDRASFLWASVVYAEAVCRAIYPLNRRYITAWARLQAMSKQMSIVPDNFATLIDTVSGANQLPASYRSRYEAKAGGQSRQQRTRIAS